MGDQTTAKAWFRKPEEVEPVELWPGVARCTMVWGERTMLCQVSLAKGQAVAMHSHPHEQIGYVASGLLRFTVDGQSADLGPGDAYLIPGGSPHEVYAYQDSVAIDVFSPPREEYK